ncbi:MAG: ABC transporter ATP-binding protein [Thiothrix sp.]|nr:ABC transporter ATP-binding protein [Thiothrix sp.]HPQ96629.1 ABC transporter ATP-binding protein [Thiolinea sp.]
MQPDRSQTDSRHCPATGFRGLSKHYGKRNLLDRVELTLQAGQCLLLTGPNGSGKTTLMRILSGLEAPDQAEVRLDNGWRHWRQARPRLQQRIMYLHQQPFLFQGSVWHNLAFALPRTLARPQRQAAIRHISQWAGLEHLLTADAKRLSGGECQKVAIARALLRQPCALLLDEPTANMDRQARERTLAMIARLRDEGMALLVTSHDPAYFEAMTDVHLQLEQARLIHPASPSGSREAA